MTSLGMMGAGKPFDWAEDETPEGVFIGGEADQLTLLGLPEGLRRPGARSLRIEPTENAKTRLSEAAVALKACARDGSSSRLELCDLSAPDRDAVLDLLGEGEVTAMIATQDGLQQAVESVFAGLWVVRMEEAPDAPWLEVGDVPSAARVCVEAIARTTLPLETLVPPDGTMNVMGVLAEARHRARAWKAGDPNHIMNFTLLPMTEADASFLAAVLGQGPVRFASGGYGSARIIATALKRVWAVQYLNAMGQVILDTLEIGDIPQAARAAPEDFQDSAARIDALTQGGWA